MRMRATSIPGGQAPEKRGTITFPGVQHLLTGLGEGGFRKLMQAANLLKFRDFTNLSGQLERSLRLM